MNHPVGCHPDAPLAIPTADRRRPRSWTTTAITLPRAPGHLAAPPRKGRLVLPPGALTGLYVCTLIRAPHVVLVTFDPDMTLERLLAAPASCMVLTHGPGIGGRNRMATLQAQAALDARKPLLLAFVDLDDALRARSWLEMGR